MRVNIVMNHIAIGRLTQAVKLALAQTAEQLLHEVVTDQVIPFDTGNLQNVSSFVDRSAINLGNVSIVHDAPYAQRLYYHPEYNFSSTINSNAKGLWWDDWLYGSKHARPQLIYTQALRLAAGGVIT